MHFTKLRKTYDDIEEKSDQGGKHFETTSWNLNHHQGQILLKPVGAIRYNDMPQVSLLWYYYIRMEFKYI